MSETRIGLHLAKMAQEMLEQERKSLPFKLEIAHEVTIMAAKILFDTDHRFFKKFLQRIMELLYAHHPNAGYYRSTFFNSFKQQWHAIEDSKDHVTSLDHFLKIAKQCGYPNQAAKKLDSIIILNFHDDIDKLLDLRIRSSTYSFTFTLFNKLYELKCARYEIEKNTLLPRPLANLATRYI